MPRLSTTFWYLARPTRRTTPSLRPPSRYSWTSRSISSPVHSWNAPSASCVPVPPPLPMPAEIPTESDALAETPAPPPPKPALAEAETSIPTEAEAPSESPGWPASPSPLFLSLTWKRKVRRSWSATASALHRERAVAAADQAQHDELDRLGRRHADLDDQLAQVEHALRVELGVAADEERLLLGGAREGAGAVELAQVDGQEAADLGPE